MPLAEAARNHNVQAFLRMLSDCAAWVVHAFGRQIGGVSKLRCCICADPHLPSINGYNGAKLASFWVVTYTEKACLVVSCRTPLVVHVCLAADTAQVPKRVVSFVAINMVDYFLRPDAANVKNSKPVCGILRAANADRYVSSGWGIAASHRTYFNFVRYFFIPYEYARLGIVGKKFAQSLRGKIGFSHDALLMRIGQRPRSVSAHAGPCYSIASEAV